MVRTRRKREWAAVRRLQLIQGIREKVNGKDSLSPYQELTQVIQGEKPKVCRSNSVEGIRQNSPVPSV